jgi:hypothetical protein
LRALFAWIIIADHLSAESLAATEGPNKDLMEKQRLPTRTAHSDARAFRHGSAARATMIVVMQSRTTKHYWTVRQFINQFDELMHATLLQIWIEMSCHRSWVEAPSVLLG